MPKSYANSSKAVSAGRATHGAKPVAKMRSTPLPATSQRRLPLFLSSAAMVRQQYGVADAHEMEAQHQAITTSRSAGSQAMALQRTRQGSAPAPTGISRSLTRVVAGARGRGKALPECTRTQLEPRFGANLGAVRIHDDAQAHGLAQLLGANAFTTGSDIYFNQGRYQPESPAGQRLLAHELTHVVQQGGEANGAVQFDLMMTLPTALGAFEMDMATQGAPRPGLGGTIRFEPDPTGPYSTQIGLIQAVNITDQSGTTSPVGAPMDWRNVGGGEGNRVFTMTTGAGVAPAGLHIDILAAGRTQGQDVTPNYQENFPTNPNVFYGWLRSPTDVRPASLVDFPGWSQNSDFDFETVAKATDTQAIYGALHWGFQVRAGATTNEYAFALNAESAAFNEALDRFRGFYTHEPIVFYFDTDQSTPLPGEDAKLAGVLSYLSSFSDVVVDIDGYADERGTLGHNKRLSQDRANFIQALAISFGIDPGRIQRVEGHGETTTFSAGSASAAPGSLRANRRVVMSFHRTASTPVTAPPVLGGP